MINKQVMNMRAKMENICVNNRTKWQAEAILDDSRWKYDISEIKTNYKYVGDLAIRALAVHLDKNIIVLNHKGPLTELVREYSRNRLQTSITIGASIGGSPNHTYSNWDMFMSQSKWAQATNEEKEQYIVIVYNGTNHYHSTQKLPQINQTNTSPIQFEIINKEPKPPPPTGQNQNKSQYTAEKNTTPKSEETKKAPEAVCKEENQEAQQPQKHYDSRQNKKPSKPTTKKGKKYQEEHIKKVIEMTKQFSKVKLHDPEETAGTQDNQKNAKDAAETAPNSKEPTNNEATKIIKQTINKTLTDQYSKLLRKISYKIPVEISGYFKKKSKEVQPTKEDIKSDKEQTETLDESTNPEAKVEKQEELGDQENRIKITTWNLRNWFTNSKYLVEMQEKSQADIILVQETHLISVNHGKKWISANIPSTHSILLSSKSLSKNSLKNKQGNHHENIAKGGVAIIINKQLAALNDLRVIPTPPELEGYLKHISIRSPIGRTNVISVYIPPNAPLLGRMIWNRVIELEQSLTKKNEGIIIGGDFNASPYEGFKNSKKNRDYHGNDIKKIYRTMSKQRLFERTENNDHNHSWFPDDLNLKPKRLDDILIAGQQNWKNSVVKLGSTKVNNQKDGESEYLHHESDHEPVSLSVPIKLICSKQDEDHGGKPSRNPTKYRAELPMNKIELETYKCDVLVKTIAKIAELKIMMAQEKHLKDRPKSDQSMKELLEIIKESGEAAVKQEPTHQPEKVKRRPMIPSKLRKIKIETLNQANHINYALRKIKEQFHNKEFTPQEKNDLVETEILKLQGKLEPNITETNNSKEGITDKISHLKLTAFHLKQKWKNCWQEYSRFKHTKIKNQLRKLIHTNPKKANRIIFSEGQSVRLEAILNKENNQLIFNPVEIIRRLSTYYTNLGKKSESNWDDKHPPPEWTNSVPRPSEDLPHKMKEFTYEIFQEKVSKLKKNKLPGPDGVYNE